MALKLITPPTTYPVSMVEAKAHLRVDFTDDDTLIEIYRKAATEDVENFTGRAFCDQTWDLYLDEFPAAGGEIKIPKPPLIEVVGVFNLDSAGTEQEFSAASYSVDSASQLARIVPIYGGSWPTPQTIANAVRVRFRTGYVDEEQSPPSGSVPNAIKAAILMTLGTLYQNRETVVIGQTAAMLPWAAEQILRKGDYRVHTSLA